VSQKCGVNPIETAGCSVGVSPMSVARVYPCEAAMCLQRVFDPAHLPATIADFALAALPHVHVTGKRVPSVILTNRPLLGMQHALFTRLSWPISNLRRAISQTFSVIGSVYRQERAGELISRLRLVLRTDDLSSPFLPFRGKESECPPNSYSSIAI
jgi:hypothetical protein